MKPPRILTTVVGSYPVPDWLARAPSEQALVDATRVVIATQERAGIDLVCDGELYRFDPDHPETNGMIEYFVRPMSGVRRDIGFSEWLAYSRGAGMRFRARPPGVVEGPIGAGTLNLVVACARARALASRPFKFTVTGPHMLAKTVHDRHYRDPEKLAHAIAEVLAAQVRQLDADVVQLDEANLPGHPHEWRWAGAARDKGGGAGAEKGGGGGGREERRGQSPRPPERRGMGGRGDQQGARRGAEEGESGGAPVLRELRRASRPEGRLGEAARL